MNSISARSSILLFAFLLSLGLAERSAYAETVYQDPKDFIDQAFAGEVPKPSKLNIIGAVRERAEDILDHPSRALRTRYWKRESKTVWILEEIGKTKPITVGIIVQDAAIKDVCVLIYRESHGAEVRHPFFTDQFSGITLEENGRLSSSVDGIAGATLSVYALRKLARLALYFDAVARENEKKAP